MSGHEFDGSGVCRCGASRGDVATGRAPAECRPLAPAGPRFHEFPAVSADGVIRPCTVCGMTRFEFVTTGRDCGPR